MIAGRLLLGLGLFVGIISAQQYVISTVAGGVPPASGPAVNTSIGLPSAVVTDPAGSVYFSSLNCVFKVDSSGALTRIAGNSRPGYSGDGGPATAAQLHRPAGLAMDNAGNLFIADSENNRIRRVSPGGIIATVAGQSSQGSSGDGGPAVSATFVSPTALAFDGSGNLYVADVFHIRRISPSGIVTAVAGNGSVGFAGDGGPAKNAEFKGPDGLAIDAAGDIYIADSNNFRIREITPDGIINTVAGTGAQGYSGDGGPAVAAELNYPYDVAMDTTGNLLIADAENGRIRRISASGMITTIAGNGSFAFGGDGGPALNASMYAPSAVVMDVSGNLFIVDSNNHRIREVLLNGNITTVAGNGTLGYSGDGGPAVDAQLATPWGIAVDAAENVYFADPQENRIRKITADGTISTFAGTGMPGYSGDGGPAVDAQLYAPYGSIVADGRGNVYITDSGNERIRKISAKGTITTVAAGLYVPNGIAVDPSGNIFIANTGTNTILKASPDGTVSTIAGTGTAGFSGDGGPAIDAQFFQPQSVAVDSAGNVYVADQINNRIRMIAPDGIITTVAAVLSPFFVAVDSTGNLLIASDYNLIQKVSPAGIVTTIAGTPTQYGIEPGYTGDGGPAKNAQMIDVLGLAIDIAGNVFVTDMVGSAVRKLTPTSQSVMVSAVVNAASELAGPVSPGEIVVIYGGGMGPATGVSAAPTNGAFGTNLAGTTITVNGLAAPVFYASATQVNAIIPYGISGPIASITVASQSGMSTAFSVPAAPSAPALFSYNASGAGQAAAVNFATGSVNTAANPVKIGDYIELYATGEGQTSPAGVDGKLAGLPLPAPNLPVTVTVGGVNASVQYYGAAYGEVAGLMQVNVQIPPGVVTGGYVPVVLTVGTSSTPNGAFWIAVSN